MALAIGVGVLPIVGFCVILFGALEEQLALSLLVIPLALTALTFAVSSRLGSSGAFTAGTTLVGAATNFSACGMGWVGAVFIDLFGMF